MTPEKHVKGPLRQILYLAIQNKALRGVSLVDVVLPVREGVPRFIHLRLESAAPLFPETDALTPGPFLNGFLVIRAASMDGFLSSSVFFFEKRSCMPLGVCSQS